MPWVKLDDRFPSHRKIDLLSDRAFRLYVSALCWSSENLTEGHIPDANVTRIAHVRNTKATAKELEERGLWERVDDGWQIHDYLDYNPTRASIQTERQRNAARQQEYRDKKKAAEAKKAAAAKIEHNAVTPPVTKIERNGGSNAAPAPARPDQGLLPDGSSPAAGSEPAPYDTLGDLKRAIAAAGLTGFSWRLQASQIQRTKSAMDRVGVQPMVDMAVGNAQLKGLPANASAWIADWESIEPITGSALPANAGPNVIALSSGPPSRPPVSDQRAQQALEAGRRVQAAADAQRLQESS